MESAQGRYSKPAQRSLPINDGFDSATCEKSRTSSGEPAFAQTALAFGLLMAAIDEAVQSVEANDVQFAVEGRRLQARAIESICASAVATIEFMDAVSTEGQTNVPSTQTAPSWRQREVLNDGVIAFLAAARDMISVMTALRSGPVVDCSKAGSCQSAPCDTQNVVERLKTLTERQRSVLELIADGLPNKIIAYKLGLCETTVKAHVSEILRKLCVYSRARAIVLLTNIDMASIDRSSSANAKSGGSVRPYGLGRDAGRGTDVEGQQEGRHKSDSGLPLFARRRRPRST